MPIRNTVATDSPEICLDYRKRTVHYSSFLVTKVAPRKRYCARGLVANVFRRGLTFFCQNQLRPIQIILVGLSDKQTLAFHFRNHARYRRFVLIAYLAELGGCNALGESTHYHEILGVCASKTVFFHLFALNLCYILVYIMYGIGKQLKSFKHIKNPFYLRQR